MFNINLSLFYMTNNSTFIYIQQGESFISSHPLAEYVISIVSRTFISTLIATNNIQCIINYYQLLVIIYTSDAL